MELKLSSLSSSAEAHRARAPGRGWVGLGAALLMLFATGAQALDLPRLGKPERERQGLPGGSLLPPGREAEPELGGRAASQAAREAQAINGGGRVLSVDEADGGWRVKLLKDGNVRFVFVPD